MRVHTADGKLFSLTAERVEDGQFLDSLNHQWSIHLVKMVLSPPGPSGWSTHAGAVVEVDQCGARALAAQTARQALSAFGELVRLGFREAAQERLPGAASTNPDTQEAFAARLVELQAVVDAWRVDVRQGEVEVEKVMGAHTETVAGQTIAHIRRNDGAAL